MNAIEVRTSIEATYRDAPCAEFLRHLKWRLHDMMWGGFTSPSSMKADVCVGWIFNVIQLHPTPDAANRVAITIDGRYDAKDTGILLDQMKTEIERNLDFALTPCGHSAPVSTSLNIQEWPFNRPEAVPIAS